MSVKGADVKQKVKMKKIILLVSCLCFLALGLFNSCTKIECQCVVAFSDGSPTSRAQELVDKLAKKSKSCEDLANKIKGESGVLLATCSEQ